MQCTIYNGTLKSLDGPKRNKRTNFENLKFFKSEKRRYLPHFWSDNNLKGTDVNRGMTLFKRRITWNYHDSFFNKLNTAENSLNQLSSDLHQVIIIIMLNYVMMCKYLTNKSSFKLLLKCQKRLSSPPPSQTNPVYAPVISSRF